MEYNGVIQLLYRVGQNLFMEYNGVIQLLYRVGQNLFELTLVSRKSKEGLALSRYSLV